MPIIIKLQDIDEAIENLNYKSETTLKSRLIRAIRNYYADESAIETIKSIEPEELVKLVWETGEDHDLIKTKRKNFSSLKSSVNSDLKKIYVEGKNYQGIIIGHNNVFDISDEAKDKALASIIDIFKEKGIDTSSKITEILAALGDILSSKIESTAVMQDSQGEIDRLKNILGGLSDKLGLSSNNISAQIAAAGVAGSAGSVNTDDAGPVPLDKTDKDLAGLGADKGSSDAGETKKLSVQDKRDALTNIKGILKEKNTDTADKLNQIATAINDLLTEAITTAGSGLSDTDAAQMKDFFGGIAGKSESSLQKGMGIDGLGEELGLVNEAGIGKDSDRLGSGDATEGLRKASKASSEDLNKNTLSSLIDILSEQGMNITGKIGKIISAINEILSEAVDSAGTGLKGDEAQQIKGLFQRLAGKIESSLQGGMGIETLGKELGLGDESGLGKAGDELGLGGNQEGLGATDAGTGKDGDKQGLGEGQEGLGDADGGKGEGISEEDKSEALSGFTDILKDEGTDSGGKVGKIMAAINQYLNEAIGAAGSGLSDTDAAKIRKLFGGLVGKIESSLQGGVGIDGLGKELGLGDQPGLGKAGDELGLGATDAGSGKDRDKPGFGEAQEGIGDVGDGKGEGLGDDGKNSGIFEKDKGNTLTGIADILQEKDTDAGGKIGKIISAVNQFLSEAISTAGSGLSDTEAAQIKGLFGGLAGKIESSLQGGTSIDGLGKELGLGDEAGIGDAEKLGSGDTQKGFGDKETGKGEGLGGDGKDSGISEEDKGKAFSGIADILQDEGTDAGGKFGKIMTAINQYLNEAISTAGSGLSDTEAAQIKGLFRGLAGKIESSLQGGVGIDGLGKELGLGDEEGIGNAGAKQGLGETEEGLGATDAGIGGDGDKQGLGEGQEGLGDKETGKGEGLGGNGKDSGISEEGKGNALTGIADILKDEGNDAAGKLNKIAAEINTLLADTLSAAAAELSNKEAEGIKNLFTNLASKIKTSLHDGLGIDPVAENVALADQLQAAGITSESVESGEFEIIEDMQESGSDEVIEVVEEIVDDDYIDEAQGSLEEVETPGAQESIGRLTANTDISDPDAGVIEQTLGAEEIVEILEELPGDDAAQPGTDGQIAAEGAAGEEAGLAQTELAGAEKGSSRPTDGLVGGEMEADEIVEIVEDVSGEGSGASLVGGESAVGLDDQASGAADYDEVIEVDGLALETDGAKPEGGFETEEVFAESYEDVEIVEGIDGQEITAESSGSQAGAESSGTLNISGDAYIDADLRDKAQLLSELAQAAKALEKLGPDLSGTIYSEQEIKEKAKFLSEEFDRYLSIREKFYNQHILIRAGDFLVGGSHFGKAELPEQIIKLGDFYIGKFPVTNAVFEIFVEKTGYVTTAEKYGYGLVYVPQLQKLKNHITGVEQFIWNNQLQCKKVQGACWHHPSGPSSSLHVKRTHPVVQVSLDDACAFAAWTGKRIPTEKEWEAAARTSRGYLYPWGNAWKENACNIETSLHGDTAPVDKYLAYANVSEVADTLGNVLEWTLDSAGANDAGDESEEIYIVKGASWASDSSISLADRKLIEKNTSSNILGFRCIAI